MCRWPHAVLEVATNWQKSGVGVALRQTERTITYSGRLEFSGNVGVSGHGGTGTGPIIDHVPMKLVGTDLSANELFAFCAIEL